MVPQRASRGMGAQGRFQVLFQVMQSHIAATYTAERPDPSIFEIADAVRSALAFPIDYIAFQNRGAYETVLDVCINNRTGAVETIPIFEPILEAKVSGLCFNAHDDKSKIAIPWKPAAIAELPTALHDLTSATRYPRRTFEYCRMALEMVRRHFDPKNIPDRRKRLIEGELAMCSALKIKRKSLQALDAVAARSRHGELVISINWRMRKRALELAWEVVARFIAHLQGTQHDQWRELDLRIED